MPNSQNRSKNNSNAGKGHSKDISSKASAPKANPERSDLKRGGGEDRGTKGDTGRTSNQGRKRASGGSAND
ncbi:MAG TPA: hypothetical protein VFR58_04890 [Flavisolibacter sp.]|nr:hypothetical protein [Flavisolibacter sp.]